jgi:hypothetical protein
MLIEAALIATATAPGLLRQEWSFEAWHDHDKQVCSYLSNSWYCLCPYLEAWHDHDQQVRSRRSY